MLRAELSKVDDRV